MQRKVKDFMIALEDYPSVSQEATLSEAVECLEDAHKKLPDKYYRPRSVLVTDEKGDVVGKLTLWAAIRGLEPKYGQIADFNQLTHFGLNPEFIRSMVEKHTLWTDTLSNLCHKAAAIKVKSFMVLPKDDEFVDEEVTLADAIHQLIMSHHLSLLVKRGEKVIGFLRLCDVFQEVYREVKSCEI